jgi:hypothetical protein
MVSFTSRPLYPKETAPSTTWTGRTVSPKTSPDSLEKVNSLAPAGNRKVSWLVQSTALLTCRTCSTGSVDVMRCRNFHRNLLRIQPELCTVRTGLQWPARPLSVVVPTRRGFAQPIMASDEILPLTWAQANPTDPSQVIPVSFLLLVRAHPGCRTI